MEKWKTMATVGLASGAIAAYFTWRKFRSSGLTVSAFAVGGLAGAVLTGGLANLASEKLTFREYLKR